VTAVERSTSSIVFQDLRVEIESDQRDLLGAAERRFAALDHDRPTLGAPLRFVFKSVPLIEIGQARESSRVVYESERGSVHWDDSSGLLEVCATTAYARCDPRAGWAELSVAEGTENAGWLVSRPLFTFSLWEMLKMRGRFAVHAGGVASNDGNALLIAGASGAGKSTLTAALAARGLAYLGDDSVFLEEGGDSAPAIVPFPEELDLSDRSLELLRFGHRQWTRLAGIEKWQVAPRDAGLAVRSEPVVPAVLVFPYLSAGDPDLEAIGSDEAFLALAPNVVMTDPATTERHLELIGRLAASSVAYRFGLGADLGAAASVLADLMGGPGQK
jgi:hypothetical protein